MELFKYCKREHVPQQSSPNGSAVLLGTLFNYRDTEKFGGLIGDKSEGRKNVSGTFKGLNSKNIDQLPVLKCLIQVGEQAKIGTLNVENLTITSPDCFIFSTSREYSRTEHERWYKDENARYDACYKIHSSRLFFRELSRVLGARGKFRGMAPVQYKEKFALTDPDLSPAIVKQQPDEHQSQQEIRAVWLPSDGVEMKPILLQETRVALYCSLYKTIDQL